MSLESIVRDIFKENCNYNSVQQAVNQAKSLNALSDDLYTDPLRFIYELVQNCDDAYDGLKKNDNLVRIEIIGKKYLCVAHYGKPFDENDVRGVCRVGCGNKRTNVNKTGYKGLGFKSVFGQSQYVVVVSNKEYFRFEANAEQFIWNKMWVEDKQTWEKNNNQKFQYPWQICPIWTKRTDLSTEIQSWLDGQDSLVGYCIEITDIDKMIRCIEYLKREPHVFMFLRNVHSILLSTDKLTSEEYKVRYLKDGSLTIRHSNNKLVSHWLLHQSNLDVPERVLRDKVLPEKLKNVKKISMTLAMKINLNDEFEPVKGDNSVLFSYLPTKISMYNFPMLVNTQFLVNASREHIRIDSTWNQWLFSHIPIETFRWIGELNRHKKWSNKAYDLLPNLCNVRDSLGESYNNSLASARREMKYLLGTHGQLLSIDEAIVDMTNLSADTCFGHKLITDYLAKTNTTWRSFTGNPFVKKHYRIRNLRVFEFTWEKAITMLNSPIFLSQLNPEIAIRYLEEVYRTREFGNVCQRIDKIPLLLSHRGVLRRFNEIYFSSNFNSSDWLQDEDVEEYVHPTLAEWVKMRPDIGIWLRSLGVQEKTDLTFVYGSIIPNADRFINRTNAIPTIARLFSLFREGLVKTHDFSSFRYLKLLTCENTLITAHLLYFSTPYQPHLNMETYIDDAGCFLSPIYLECISAPLQTWKSFFLHMGVQESINLYRFDQYNRDELTAAYSISQESRLTHRNEQNFGFKNALTIKFIERTQNDWEFARFFWDYIMHSIQIQILNQNDTLISSRRISVPNLVNWCIHNRNCIPTTTKNLLKCTEVYSSELRNVIGEFLPVFACDLPQQRHAEWLCFFKFRQQLSIEDHLYILQQIHLRTFNECITNTIEQQIQSIYQSLLKVVTNIKPEQHEKYSNRPIMFLLSTRDGEFLRADQLLFSNDPDCNLPSDIPQLRLSVENIRHAHIAELLSLLKVRQMTKNQLKLHRTFAKKHCFSLQSRFHDIQDYLYRMVDIENIQNHSIDTDLQFFEAKSLELYFEDRIRIQEVNVHVVGKNVYVKQPWKETETAMLLSKELSKLCCLPGSFENNIQNLLQAESLQTIEEHILSQNPRITFDYTGIEQYILDIKKHRFHEEIRRDNERLFSMLNFTSEISAGDMLLAGLEAQNKIWSGYVYHFTHIENAVRILNERKLRARRELQKEQFYDSAAKSVIAGTSPEVTSNVRFYFRPLTPTQLCNENLGSSKLIERFNNRPMCPVPVFFRFKLSSILSKTDRWKVSLGNLASQHAEFGSSKEIVEKFDFQYVYANLRTERGKFSSQHEFLIESSFDFDLLDDEDITLIVQDEQTQLTLSKVVESLRYTVIMDSNHYFNSHSKVLITTDKTKPQHVTVRLNEQNDSKDYDFQLLVQIKGKNPATSVTGKLIGIFQSPIYFTIQGKKRISFVTHLQNILFSVYLVYHQEIWLIYSNFSNPSYEKPSEELDH